MSTEAHPANQVPTSSSAFAMVGKHALSLLAGVLTLVSVYSLVASVGVLALGGFIPNYGAVDLQNYLIADTCFVIPTIVLVWWMYRINKRRFTALYFGTSAALALALLLFALLIGGIGIGSAVALAIALPPTILAALSHRVWPPNPNLPQTTP